MHENANIAEATTQSEASTGTEVARFDTKVVVVLREDLLPWQELNVTAFLMSGVATSASDLVGENYRDADGNVYLPMLRQPVLVMTAGAEELNLVGIALRGPKNAVDRVVKGARMHGLGQR